MAQLLIIPTQSNSNPITHALTTIALSRSRKREMRSVLRPTSRLPGNSIRNWPATSRPRIQKAILLRELRQSVSWMASSSSTCPLISRVILTTQRTQKHWPNSQARMERGERSCAARTGSRPTSWTAISKCAWQNTRKASNGCRRIRICNG